MRAVAVLTFMLAGCATIDASSASRYTTLELCQIVVMGTSPTHFFDQASRREAELEATRRGINCMDYAAEIRAGIAQRSAAMAQGAQAMQGYAPAPVPVPTTLRTTCQTLANGTTACSSQTTGGPPQAYTCRTLANGYTHCE